MPFAAKEKMTIPTQDIMSWYFDQPKYDLKKKIYVDAKDPNRYYTGETAKSTIRKLIAGFKKYGMKPGETVCLHGFNSIDYPILVNGIVAFGGIFAGTNPSYSAAELVHHIKTGKCRMIIAEPSILNSIKDAAYKAGVPQSRILILNQPGEQVPKGFDSWKKLLEHGESDWVKFDSQEKAKNTEAARLFSSGTTGLPKAAIITHYNLIAQHTLVYEHKPKDYEIRRIAMLPFFHAAAVPVTHFTPLRSGHETVVMRRFELEPWLKAVQDFKITDAAMVPPIVMSIINSDKTKNYDLSSLKYATAGAAPLDKGPQAKFQALMAKGAPFTQVLGMTETTCTVTQFYYPEHDDSGSIGYPVPNVEIKLVDDDAKDITDWDVRGELCVRGPIVIKGYFENPEANKSSFDKEGYFHTGDIGYRDGKTGKFYIVDRKKELIKVRGFQVAPPELEALLLDHPGIADAAVIGVQLEKDGSEFPRCYVVKKDNEEGKKLDEDAIRSYMKENLAKYKQPEGGVKILDEIPKNASGKILKKDLRERAKKEIGAKL